MSKVGKKKINYNALSKVYVDKSVVTYRKFVIGVIKKNPIFSYALRNEELISDLVTEAALADWRYDPSKGSKRESFRHNAIVFFLRKQQMKKKDNTVCWPDFSLTGNETTNPVKLLMQEEDGRKTTKLVGELLDTSGLTPLEKDYVRLHYLEELSVKEISLRYTRSRQSVDLKIKNGLKKIRGKVNG